MTDRSFRQIEQLSASLDGQLSAAHLARLQGSLATDPELATIQADLRMTRALLRRAPKRRAPRNFTLQPNSSAIRPPVPRSVPAFSWASAVATFLFLVTFGSTLLSGMGFSAPAPMRMEAPAGMGGDGVQEADDVEILTAPPVADSTVPLPEDANTKDPAPEWETGSQGIAPDRPEDSSLPIPFNWSLLWLSLALFLISTAMLIRWLSALAFKRRLKK